jgi:plasmid stabilization system protein ParE
MRKVIWLPEAVDDLLRLREFIGDKNRKVANKAATTIKNIVKILESYPDIIHPLEDLPDFHDLVVPFGSGGYIVRYRIEETTVYIMEIRHSKEEEFRL